jgi:hypothetical protein
MGGRQFCLFDGFAVRRWDRVPDNDRKRSGGVLADLREKSLGKKSLGKWLHCLAPSLKGVVVAIYLSLPPAAAIHRSSGRSKSGLAQQQATRRFLAQMKRVRGAAIKAR